MSDERPPGGLPEEPEELVIPVRIVLEVAETKGPRKKREKFATGKVYIVADAGHLAALCLPVQNARGLYDRNPAVEAVMTAGAQWLQNWDPADPAYFEMNFHIKNPKLTAREQLVVPGMLRA